MLKIDDNFFVESKTIISKDRIFCLGKFLGLIKNLEGEIWELGVYKGGSAKIILKILEMQNLIKTIRLFDTFEGLKDKTNNDGLEEGKFNDVDYNCIIKYFNQHSNVKIYKGMIQDTIPNILKFEDIKISFLHLDLDYYNAYRWALNNLYDFVVNNGIILCDDYGFPKCKGAKMAIDEFNKGKIIRLLTGQAVILKE